MSFIIIVLLIVSIVWSAYWFSFLSPFLEDINLYSKISIIGNELRNCSEGYSAGGFVIYRLGGTVKVNGEMVIDAGVFVNPPLRRERRILLNKINELYSRAKKEEKRRKKSEQEKISSIINKSLETK